MAIKLVPNFIDISQLTAEI